LEEEKLYQRKDAEHSTRLATTAKTIPFGSPTANPLSKSQLNEILAQILPSVFLSVPNETSTLLPNNSLSS
jgi:hypothetical protein